MSLSLEKTPQGPSDADREAARSTYRKSWTAALVAAVAILVVKVVRTDDRSTWLVVAAVLVPLVGLLFGGALLWVRSRTAQARRAAGPDGFAAFCALADDPQNSYLLLLREESLLIGRANGRSTVLECPWSEVRGASPGLVVIGPWRRQGVRLELTSGAVVDLAFPSPWVVTYPVELAERALAEVLARTTRG